ncbi:MAG: type II toxin-antitoxin system VapC family toxin [Acidobacteria bacterium]|nr:type II toxin-antitoxin system VapC family toxin [Acidobacteriota bacterium]
MNRVVADASALAALTFQEPGVDEVKLRLMGAQVFAPRLLQFEMANVAWKRIRREPEDALATMTLLQAALGEGSGIEWMDVNVTDVVLIAQATGLTAYDASYLWLAASLGADLVTLDKRLAAASTMDI